MTLTTQAVQALETRLPKVLSARTHGMIDYAHAAFFLTLAFGCRKKNPRAALAALGTGTFVLVQSLLTDYPLGAKKVLPFATHGQMDAGFAAMSMFVPTVLGFSGTKAAQVFQANSFVEAAVVGLTDFDTERARGNASDASPKEAAVDAGIDKVAAAVSTLSGEVEKAAEQLL